MTPAVEDSGSAATRRELDLLRQDQRDLVTRVDLIDRDGTRGGIRMQEQLVALTDSVASLAGAIDAHKRGHVVSRRWTIGAVVGALTALEGPIVWIVTHLHG